MRFRGSTLRRRDLLKGAALFPAAMAANADLPEHLWQGFDFGSGPPVRERLNQSPFDIGQDQGWQTILFITPSEKPIRNPGLGLVGYTCVGRGPSLRRGHSPSVLLLPAGYRGVQLLAQIEIRPGMKKPIAWACAQSRNSDGSITIDLKSENGPGWRKGV